ncbi:unnamed protein product, partial [marine sediment metagenome]
FVKDMYVFASVAGVVALICSVSIWLLGYLVIGPNMPILAEFAAADVAANPSLVYADQLNHYIVAYAQLIAFVATLSFELWFVFIARNDNQTSLLKSKPFKNNYLLGAVALSWILLVGCVYIPQTLAIFSGFKLHYYALTGMDWLVMLSITLGMCIAAELFRYLFRADWFQRTFRKAQVA